MSPHAALWWIVAAGLAAALAASGVRLVQAFRAVQRIAGRVEALADVPVLTSVERAEADLVRIESAAARVPALIDRTNAAVAVIRKGPVPPELLDAVARVRREVSAFRSLARR